MSLERPEQDLAWELRGAWAAQRPVVLTLSERCLVARVEGMIEQVAVTGAFVVIDGWHIPVVEVLTILKPHFTQEPEREQAARKRKPKPVTPPDPLPFPGTHPECVRTAD